MNDMTRLMKFSSKSLSKMQGSIQGYLRLVVFVLPFPRSQNVKWLSRVLSWTRISVRKQPMLFDKIYVRVTVHGSTEADIRSHAVLRELAMSEFLAAANDRYLSNLLPLHDENRFCLETTVFLSSPIVKDFNRQNCPIQNIAYTNRMRTIGAIRACYSCS